MKAIILLLFVTRFFFPAIMPAMVTVMPSVICPSAWSGSAAWASSSEVTVISFSIRSAYSSRGCPMMYTPVSSFSMARRISLLKFFTSGRVPEVSPLLISSLLI